MNRYELGPKAPVGSRMAWGGKVGWRIYLRSTRDYGSGEIMVTQDDPFFRTLVDAGVIQRPGQFDNSSLVVSEVTA